MSSGYKHLYSCVTFILFMVVVNFYKNKIHQAREREASVRAKMSGGPQKLSSYQLHRRETTLDEEASIMYPGDYYADKIEAEFQRRFSNADSLLDRMLKEFPAKCRDMESRQPPIDPNLAQSNSSMYVFLSVLIILIIAAGVDIAKHIRANPRRQENIRRLSLQNYQALIREKQKQFRMMKQHCSQPSMSINRSIDETNFPPPFRPATKEDLDTKPPPPPLLRRQSVPIGLVQPPSAVSSLARPSLPGGGGKHLLRRPSMDSFGLADRGDGDTVKHANGSPTDMRRRVRMLHRH
ncbi:hypothetical protein quinque_005633 [Culex quinquefasciatus]